MEKASSYFQATLALAATLWVLIEAREVLQPFLIGLFICFLLNATAQLYERVLKTGAFYRH